MAMLTNVYLGKELAAGVSGPKGEEIGEVVKAIDGIVNDLKNLGDAVSYPALSLYGLLLVHMFTLQIISC